MVLSRETGIKEMRQDLYEYVPCITIRKRKEIKVNVAAAVVLNGSSVNDLFPLRLVHIADILDDYVRQ